MEQTRAETYRIRVTEQNRRTGEKTIDKPK